MDKVARSIPVDG